MADRGQEMLEDAIARNCAVVFSLPSAGMLRHHKSRFITSSSAGIWVEAPINELPLIRELIGSAKPAGLSFKGGHTKVVFASPILEFRENFQLNSATAVPAAMIAIPTQIKAIQRRANYRVRICPGIDVTARVWRIAPRVHLKDRPLPSHELKIELRDLSVGGLGVTFIGENGQPPRISTSDRLRIELQYRETVMLMEGAMRTPTGPQPANGIFTGIQFKESAADIECRQKASQMARIIAELQREEVRRARTGVA